MRKSTARTQPPPPPTKRVSSSNAPGTTKASSTTVPRCDACKQSRSSAVLKTPCVHFQQLQKKQKQQQTENNQEEQSELVLEEQPHQEDEIASVTCSSAPSSGSTWAGVEHNIITAVRLRPMLAAEKKQGYRRIVDLSPTGSNWTRIVNPASLEPGTRTRTSTASSSSSRPTKTVVSKTASVTPTVNFLSQFTQEFHFDFNFWSYDRGSPERPPATQSAIYEELGVFAVQSAWQGYNCSIFAYGQTSAGKTYTMMGSEKDERPSTAANSSTTASNSNNNVRTVTKSTPSIASKKQPARAVNQALPAQAPVTEPVSASPARRGLIPRICRGVFDKFEAAASEGRTPPIVHVSYVEIYHEHVYDLLAPTAAKESLKVREHPEDGIFVENANQIPVNRFEQVMIVIEGGNRARSVASTNANNRSSRSHAILTLYLTHAEPAEGRSKLCLVDLAGSERVDHSGTTGTRLRETGSINKSLATLADVINALSKRSQSFASSSPSSISSTSSSQQFIPYRNSVLTRLLKESLGGNAKTIMLAAISPCCAHYEETLSTLKYIERAKSVVNVARINTDGSNNGGTLVQELRREISELKSTLQTKSPTNAVPRNIDENVDRICLIETVSVGTTTDVESSPTPNNPSHDDEKTKMEREVAKLRAIIKKQEQDGLQEQATMLFHDKVSGQILRQHAHLINLVAVYRRMRFVRRFQAMERWRRNIMLLNQCHPLTRECQDEVEHEENQGFQENGPDVAGAHKTPTTSDSRKVKEQKSPLGTPPRWKPKQSPVIQEQRLEVDAICYSVVDEFFSCPVNGERKRCESKTLIDHDNQHVIDHCMDDQATRLKDVEFKSLEQTDSNQALEISEECPDFMIDMPSLDIEWGSSLEAGEYADEPVDEEYDCENPENEDVEEDDSVFYEEKEERYGAPTVYRKSSTTQQKQRMQANVSTCLDAIDIARRAMGPTMRKLRKLVSKPPVDGIQQFTGMERQLLIHSEKVFLRMIEHMNEARQAIPSAKSFATDRELFVKMEELMNAFCLDVVGRLCAYLIRPAGCAELINPHEILMKQLTIVQDQLTSVLCRMTTESFQSMTLVVVEFFGLTERIKSVLHAIDHKNRQRLVLLKAQQDLVATSGETIHRLQTQVTGLETRCKELSQGCSTPISLQDPDVLLNAKLISDEQAATISSLEDNLTLASTQIAEFQDKQQSLRLSLAVQHKRIVKLEEIIDAALNRREITEKSCSNSSCSTPDASNSLAYTHLFVRLEDELASALTQMNEFETCQSPKTEIASGASQCTMSDLERECADRGRELDESNSTAAKLINTIEEVLLAVSSGDHQNAGDQLSSALMITHELVSSHTAAMVTLAKLRDTFIQSPRAEIRSAEASPLMRGVQAQKGYPTDQHHSDESIRMLIKSLEQDVDISRNRIQELEACNESLRVVCSDQKAFTTKLEWDYSALVSTSREQAAYVSSNEANLATVQSKFAAATHEAKDWKEQHDQLALAYESLQNMNDSVAGELMDVISSVESLESQLAASRTHCADLENSCAAAHDRIVTLTKELDGLCEEKAKLEVDLSTDFQQAEELSALQEQFANTLNQISILEAAHASMTFSQATAQARNDQLEQDLALALVHETELKEEKSALEQTYCTRIAELETKLTDTELRFQVLEEMLATASTNGASNQIMEKSLKHELSLAATRSFELETHCRELMASQASEQQRIHVLESDLQVAAIRRQELETALQDTSQDLALVRSQLNSLEECNHSLVEGQHSIQQERDLALAHAEHLTHEHKTSADAQAEEFDSIRAKLCVTQEHLENLQAELLCAYAKAFPADATPTIDDVITVLADFTSYEALRSKYEAQCTLMKTLEDQNNELVLELQQVEEKFAELRDAYESKALELSEMENSLVTAEDRSSTADEIIHELETTIDLEHASFVEATEALTEASATNEMLSARITELSVACELEKSRIQELEGQLSTTSTELQDYKEKYTEAKDTNELQASALAQVQEQVQREQLRNHELSDQITASVQEQQKLTQQVESLIEELRNQDILFHEATGRCDQLEKDICVLNTLCHTKELELAEKTEAWSVDKSVLEGVKTQVAELTGVVTAWKSKYAAQVDTSTALEQSVTDLKKELGQAKERLTKHELELQEAKTLSEQSNTKVEQLEQEIELLQAESIRLEDQILEITKQNNDKERGLVEYEAVVKRMQAEHQLQLIFHESHIADVESRLQALESLVTNWEHKHAIATNTNIAQQEELDQVNTLLNEADGRCEILAEELRLLKQATQSVPESDHTTEEARNIVLKHLKSLDLWFDRAILQCNVDEEHEGNQESVSATSDSLESRIMRAEQHYASQRHASHTTGDLKPKRGHDDEQVRVVDLDDLYHEISSMCCSDEPKSSS